MWRTVSVAEVLIAAVTKRFLLSLAAAQTKTFLKCLIFLWDVKVRSISCSLFNTMFFRKRSNFKNVPLQTFSVTQQLDASCGLSRWHNFDVLSFVFVHINKISCCCQRCVTIATCRSVSRLDVWRTLENRSLCCPAEVTVTSSVTSQKLFWLLTVTFYTELQNLMCVCVCVSVWEKQT